MSKKIETIFREKGGQLRLSDALREGVSRYQFYKLRDNGIIEMVSRGLYRLSDLPPVSDPDLMIVGVKYPNAVICLLSALAYYDLTTQIPHAVFIAIPKNSRRPVLDYPPIQTHRFSSESFQSGIDEVQIDGAKIKIYSPEKTLADCFKYRNKIGMETVLEALTLYKRRMSFDHKKLLKFGRICRVDKIMKPYLEVHL